MSMAAIKRIQNEFDGEVEEPQAKVRKLDKSDSNEAPERITRLEKQLANVYQYLGEKHLILGEGRDDISGEVSLICLMSQTFPVISEMIYSHGQMLPGYIQHS